MMQQTLRRTKIVATLGPSTDNEDVLRGMIMHGLNVARLNLSHDTLENHRKRIEQVLRLSEECGKLVGILVDLQGPKIRVSAFENSSVVLKNGDAFILDASLETPGNQSQVGLDYKELPNEVYPDDILLLDDGRIGLKVLRIEKTAIHTTVIMGGLLSSKKGLNRKGGGLSAAALTDKDKAGLKALADLPIDYVAVSFVKSEQDVLLARQWLDEFSIKADIVAKIERKEAIDNLTEICKASDAVMVARGDLGVEIGYAELPAVQKEIISRAQSMDKVVITATQMMESMITSTIPTRAEVSDVANAILDGTDAVMLSAETASGLHPEKVIEVMHEICLVAEKQRLVRLSHHRVDSAFAREDEAIAMAAMYIANHLNVKAIVALTESGSTPLWMSRIRSSIPIFALSRHRETCSRMTLYRGVYPVVFDVTPYKPWDVTRHALGALVSKAKLLVGDKVIVTKGNILGVGGKANTLKIVTAEAIV